MAAFRDQYRRVFRNLGSPLSARDGVAESRLRAAEKRLGVAVPKALADYYLLAGRERRFNHVFDRLLPPSEWFLDAGHLVFMEENQAVVYWGVPVSQKPIGNPPVYQGVNGEPIEWYLEHDRCSVFLLVMLHWHGAFGGAMPWSGTAPTSPQLVKKLDRTWTLVGEVNQMRAYSRQGQAACVLPWDGSWRVFCGAREDDAAATLSRELGVSWDDPGNLVARDTLPPTRPDP